MNNEDKKDKITTKSEQAYKVSIIISSLALAIVLVLPLYWSFQ